MSSKQERSHLRIPSRRPPTTIGTKHVEPQEYMPKKVDVESKKIPIDKRRISAVAIVVAVILTLLVVKFTGNDGAVNADISKQANQPTYDTVLPTGKTIDQLGGWHRVSPGDKDPVFAYNDTIASVRINVSQQPLPSGFSDDGSKLATLAKRFSATKKLTTASGTAYIGTSAKGPQSVILAKGDTLVLIKSQTTIEDQAWVAYIDSLGLSF